MPPVVAPISMTPPDSYGGGPLSNCLNDFYNLIAKICSTVFDFFKCILCCGQFSSDTSSLNPETVIEVLPSPNPLPTPLPIPPPAPPPPEPGPAPVGGGNFLPSSIDWEEEYNTQDYAKSDMKLDELVNLYYSAKGKDKDHLAAAIQKRDPDTATALSIAPSASYQPHSSAPQTFIQKPGVIQPPVKATLPERVTEAAQKAIEQIGNAYAEYVNIPIEPVLKRSSYYSPAAGNYEQFKHRPLVEILASPYVRGGFYQAINRYRRFGTLETGSYSQCFANEEDLRTYYAHFQKSIRECTDRVNTPGNLVHRVSYCAKSLVEYCVDKTQKGERLFLTNKSILSTSSEYINWSPSTCAGVSGSGQRGSQVALHMQIRLLPTSPLLNANAHGVGMRHEKEMMLPAGGAYIVQSCTEKPKIGHSYSDVANYNLVLEEVAPDSLADNAELCTNVL